MEKTNNVVVKKERKSTFTREMIILLVVTAVFYVVDICLYSGHYVKGLAKVSFHLIHFIHHLLVAFFVVGWTFQTESLLYLYAVLPFALIISWFINNHDCIISEITNRLIEKPTDEPFRNLFYTLGLKDSRTLEMIVTYFFLAIGWGIVVYRLKTRHEQPVAEVSVSDV